MEKIVTPEFEICRCDLGSGGWSLHAPKDDPLAGEFQEIIFASGDSLYRAGKWSRPNKADYRRASVEYRRLVNEAGRASMVRRPAK